MERYSRQEIINDQGARYYHKAPPSIFQTRKTSIFNITYFITFWGEECCCFNESSHCIAADGKNLTRIC